MSLARGVSFLNWAWVRAVADIIAATGVIISLFYLGWQLRRTARTVRAATLHSITSDASQLNNMLAGNAEFTKVILAGYDGEELCRIDAYRFRRFMHSYFRFHENLYFQSYRFPIACYRVTA